MFKFLAAAALALVVATSMVFAQAPAPPGPAPAFAVGSVGSTTVISGLITTQQMMFNISDPLRGIMYPYIQSSVEIATTSSTDPIFLIALGTGVATYNQVWNFTLAESALIKAWLRGFAVQRSNNIVSFTATWDAQGRFALDFASWVFIEVSLMPYGINPATCDPVTALTCLAGLEASIPLHCVNSGVPLLKGCTIANAACLALIGKAFTRVHSYCTAQRSVIDTLFCTDGRLGGDAICGYVRDALPNGIPGAAVTTVGANGLPTAGRAGMGSAGAIATTAVVALVAVLAALAF